jgi:hypothetical protein
MHGHFDLKKSHFDARNRVPDVDSDFQMEMAATS